MSKFGLAVTIFNVPTTEFLPYSVPWGPLVNSVLSNQTSSAFAACGRAT